MADDFDVNVLARLLGEQGFPDLLVRIPDSFYQAEPRIQNLAWRLLKSEAARGQRDLQILAKLAEDVVRVNPSIAEMGR